MPPPRDPLIAPSDPQSHTGYSYARNNPVSNTDPTGTMHDFVDSASMTSMLMGMGAGYHSGEVGAREVFTYTDSDGTQQTATAILWGQDALDALQDYAEIDRSY